MSSERDAYRHVVSYIDRTREFYAAQGYEKPYRWAAFDDAPFAPLPRPLAECRATLVTTASPWRGQEVRDGVLRGSKQVWSGDMAEPPERLFTDDLAWDKGATHTNDVESFLPIRQLQAQVAEGRLGSVANRFHGVPTDYSQRRTIEQDAPEILARCREDGVDVALLVPLWPVCHQTVSLVARHLEAHGIPTVVVGSARDIVEQCGVARFLFSDFPLGNPCGRPYDTEMQRAIVGYALDLLETATLPRTTVQTPFRWSDDPSWKDAYARVDAQAAAKLRQAGEARRARQQQARDEGRARSGWAREEKETRLEWVACKKHGGFDIGSIGGPAAILAQDDLEEVEVVDFEEPGMEAVWKIEVEGFPAFIVVDDKGNDVD